MKHTLPRLPVVAALAVIASTLFPAAHAGSRFWDNAGGDDKWTTQNNWGGNAVLPGDFLFFGTGFTTTPSNDFAADTLFANLAFTSGSHGFTLNGNELLLTNVMDIGSGATGWGSISNTTANAETINLPIVLNVGRHFIATTNTGVLTFNNTLTRRTNTVVVFANTTSNTINVAGSGLVTNFNILGGWATLGSNWATLDASKNIIPLSASKYTVYPAGATITNGASQNTLLLAATGVNSSNFVASGTVDINTIEVAPGADSHQVWVVTSTSPGDVLRFGKNGAIFDASAFGGTARKIAIGIDTASPPHGTPYGTITAGGAPDTSGEITLYDSPYTATAGNVEINSAIADNGTGKVSVNVIGYASINCTNTFSGGLYIEQGRVQSGYTPLALGANGANVYVFPGAQVNFAAVGTYSQNFIIGGTGSTEFNGGGAIRFGSGRGIGPASGVGGQIILLSTSSLGGGNATNCTISGKITGNGGLYFGSGNNANGHGQFTISGTNDYTGDTTINYTNSTTFGSTLRMGAPYLMPNGAGKGNLALNGSSAAAKFDMNGFSEAINGLSSSGPQTNNLLTNSSATAVTLTVGNNDAAGAFGGSIGGNLSLTKIGAGTQTLSGTNTYSGATVVSNGVLALSGSGAIPNTASVSVQSGATLDVSGESAAFTLSANPVGITNGTLITGAAQPRINTLNLTNSGISVTLAFNATNLVVTNLTTGGATNFINLVSFPSIASYPTQFVILNYTSGTIGGAGNNFGIGTSPSPVTAGVISNDTARSALVLILTDGPRGLTWAGADPVNPTFWNTTTSNWLFGATTTAFNQVDSALFNDTGATNFVRLQGTMVPSTITVSASTNYTFGGSGAIGGLGSLTKSGSGTLTLANTGSSSFTGGVAVNGGAVVFATDNSIAGGMTIAGSTTVQVGTNGGTGTLPAGNVTLNGALIFNRGADSTAANAISGPGSASILKTSTDQLTLSGDNSSFTGAIAVVNGILRLGSASALGTTNTGTTVASGATLDLNGFNMTLEPLITAAGPGVGGNGAIINNGPNQNNSLRFVTLTNHTTFGGTGRWDVRSANISDSTQGSLLTGGASYNLTKTGANQVSLVGVTVDAALGNISVQQGVFSVESATTGLGDSTKTVTVAAGATLQMFQLTTAIDKNFVLNGDGVTSTLFGEGSTAPNQNSLGGVVGSVTINGPCVFNVAAGAAMTLNLATTGSGGVTKVGAGTNFLLGSIAYTGTTTISNGALTVNGTKTSGAGMFVAPGGILAGTGSITESVTNSGVLSPGDPFTTATGTLTINGNLTLSSNTNLFTLLPGGTGSQVSGIGTLTINGTCYLRPAIDPFQPLNVGDTFTLFTFTSSNADTNTANVNHLEVLAPAGYAFHLVVSAGSVQLVTDVAIGNLIWNGLIGTHGVWDNGVTVNWNKVLDSSPARFTNGDLVTFDFNGTNVVTVASDVAPGTMTFDDQGGRNYTLQGSGKITGVGGLTLSGFNGGTVVLANGSNDFTGAIVLNNGAIQVGNGGTSGGIGSGAIIATNAGVTGLAKLVFNRSDSALVVSNAIGRDLQITNLGSGAVTLSGANTYTGGVYIVNGTIIAGSTTALGTTNSPTVVGTNATLDVNGINLGAEEVQASGTGVSSNGAIVNNSANPQTQSLRFVTLAGNTIFGGAQRWDIRGNPNAALLTTPAGSPFNITKVGTNQVSFVGITNIDAAISNLDVQAGLLSIETTTVQVGDPNGTVTVRSNATLQLYNLTGAPLNKNVVLQDGSTAQCGNSVSTISGPMTLSGNVTLGAASGATLVLSNNTISGSPVGITKANPGTLQLIGNALPTPVAVLNISGGAIDLNQAASSTLTLGSTDTLRGNGAIFGSLIANSGSAIAPGTGTNNSIGTLTVHTNVTLGSGSTALMELDAGLGISDVLVVSNNLQYGGTLSWSTNGNGVLTNGQTFKLFAVGGATTGAFSATNFPDISPLFWTNILLNGTVSVGAAVSGAPTNPATILSAKLIAGNIVIHGTNNNIPNTAFHYQVLTSTNVASPVSNWTSIATNSFNPDGTFDYTNAMIPSQPRLFYDVKAVP